tara:strand:+ start:510 stop:1778 length:1269 start_codon:yes stop_codon:yes gene_type:complete
MSVQQTKAEKNLVKELQDELEKLIDTRDDIGKTLSKTLGFTQDIKIIGEKTLSDDLKKLKVSKDQARINLAAVRSMTLLREKVMSINQGFQNLKAQALAFGKILQKNIFLALAGAALSLALLFRKVNKELAETRTLLGVGAVEAGAIRLRVALLAEQLKFSGLEAKDVRESFEAIRSTFGGIDVASNRFVEQLAKAQLNTGATSQQLADLLAIQESVTSSSREALLAQIKTTSAAIRLEGVAPDAVFRQLAENAEAVALSINDGGNNLIRAAVQARKLGVEFKTVTGIADKLLNFEESIESQLKASVLLGREINLDRARQLALNNDLAGALEEVVTQVGGEAEFNELNRIQRQALADSVGVSVQELSRLVRDNANAGIQNVGNSFTDVETYQKQSLESLVKIQENTQPVGDRIAKLIGVFEG